MASPPLAPSHEGHGIYRVEGSIPPPPPPIEYVMFIKKVHIPLIRIEKLKSKFKKKVNVKIERKKRDVIMNKKQEDEWSKGETS